MDCIDYLKHKDAYDFLFFGFNMSVLSITYLFTFLNDKKTLRVTK